MKKDDSGGGNTAGGNGENFSLEPQTPGTVPAPVITELRALRNAQNEKAVAFREAVKIQAEKHGIKPAALTAYIVALASDKLDQKRAETHDLERLIG
jgi:hypothetical protein